MAVLRLIRAVHAIGIKLTGTNPLHSNVPYVASAVSRGIEINHPGGGGIFGMIKHLQPNAAGVSAEQRKDHSLTRLHRLLEAMAHQLEHQLPPIPLRDNHGEGVRT